MKRFTALVCIFALALSLCACSKESTNDTSAEKTEGTTGKVTEEATEEITETPTEEVTETEEPEEPTDTSETEATKQSEKRDYNPLPYIEKINNYELTHEGDVIYYNLIKIDDDDIPELVIANEHSGSEEEDWNLNLYVFKGELIAQVLNEFECDNVFNNAFVYLPEEDYICYHHCVGLDYSLEIFTLDGLAEGEYYESAYFDYEAGIYTIDGQEISSDKFYYLLNVANNTRNIFGYYTYDEIMVFLESGTVPDPL